MRIKEISFSEPEKNILFDEVLLHLAEQGEGGEVLRFWESPRPFIVLGRIGKPDEDIHLGRVQQEGIPVLRRSSGGGTVVQGPGCLNYSLILSKESHSSLPDLRQSYQYILNKVINAFVPLGIDAAFMPVSDIALKQTQKKISGNAQKRGRRFLLHHGTILCSFDLELIERYLMIPRDIPEYRRARPHLEFVANTGAHPSKIKMALRDAFKAFDGAQGASKAEEDCLNGFLLTKKVRMEASELLKTA